MTREHYLARVFRALSGLTQVAMAEAIGVHPSLIGQIEQGLSLPSGEHLRDMAAAAGLSVEQGDELLERAETFRRRRLRRQGLSTSGLFDDTMDQIRLEFQGTLSHILTLPLPDQPPGAKERQEAEGLFALLKPLDEGLRSSIVRVSEIYQGWALCERVCQESREEIAQDLKSAAAWARLAQEIAEKARGTKGWRNRLQGYAAAHLAKVLEATGTTESAAAAFQESRRLWEAGSDPEGWLASPFDMPAHGQT
jgi:transcriptional regulator with XRE-family HTH domain